MIFKIANTLDTVKKLKDIFKGFKMGERIEMRMLLKSDDYIKSNTLGNFYVEVPLAQKSFNG